MRTIDVSAAYTPEGNCPTCGEEIIRATLESSNECPRCGDPVFYDTIIRKDES